MIYRSKFKNHHFFGFIVLLMTVFLASLAYADNLEISWSPPTKNADGTPLTDLDGYIIYYGTESGNYSQSIDVGNVTAYTVTGLSAGTYYVALTAYDTSGNESDYSVEESKTIPETGTFSYYCDNDSDGYIDSAIDGSCTGTSCEPSGCQTTPGNDCDDDNIYVHPGASDSNCNGVDEDCDGTPDDNYATSATSCGSGVCASTGQLICSGGSIVDTCSAGSPTGNDSNCNGVDENCNGTPDDNYVTSTTSCGSGVCSSTGQLQCQNGTEVNTCSAGPPSETTETSCDGLDNDCDGLTDEECSASIELSKVLINEDFSDGIPGAWSAQGAWGTSNSCGKNVIDYPFEEPYAIVDSSCSETGIDELTTVSLDTSSCGNVELVYGNQYYWYSGSIEVDTSDDGGATWTSAVYSDSSDGFPSSNWKNIDISSVSGVDKAQVKFKYSNSDINGYWALDNVLVTCGTSQLDFSGQVYATSASQTILINNGGNNSIVINSISIGGTDASDFSIADNENCASKILQPSESCTFEVVFSPTSAGSKSATLAVSSTDPLTSINNIALNGVAYEASMTNPAPSVKVNSSTSKNLNLSRHDSIDVTIELNPGDYSGKNADWWVLMEYRDRWYYLNKSNNRWRRGFSYYDQSAIVQTNPVSVLKESRMRPGQYKFQFGVDMGADGVYSPSQIYYDEVIVNVN